MRLFSFFKDKKKIKYNTNDKGKAKNKKGVIELPDTFEIDHKDIIQFHFMSTSKSKTSQSELNKYGERIDNEIEKYMLETKAKILSCKLKQFDIKAINVRNNPSTENYLDVTLGLDSERNEKLKALNIFSTNYSKLIATGLFFDKDKDVNLGMYLKLSISDQIMEIAKVKYKKGKVFDFTYKTHFLYGEEDSDNEEITFLSSVQNRDCNTLLDYFEQEVSEESDEFKLYSFPNVFNKSIKGIIVQNLTLDNSNSELINLEATISHALNNCEDEDQFQNIAFYLYEKYNDRIGFIGKNNGVIIIKGTEINEKCIYSTLPEHELSEGLKKLERVDNDNRDDAIKNEKEEIKDKETTKF